MEELSYFNIGFRCENIRRALESYARNSDFSRYVIQDSERILGDCLRFQEPLATNFSYQQGALPDLSTLVIETFQGKSFAEIAEALNNIQTLLGEVRNGEEGVEVEPATEFFSKLSERCLSKQNQPVLFSLG